MYAIGDLHADLAQSRAALTLLGLVDERLRWIGGNATLVQTGDLVDRGPDSLPLLKQWWELQAQARAAGGRVVTLLGNHEALNMEGDLRYVDAAELAAAGGSAAWERLFAADDGEVGRVIGTYDTAVVAGEGACRTLFVHAGLRPQLIEPRQGGEAGGGGGGEGGLTRLNEEVREELKTVRAKGAGRGLLGSDGPVWYRGYAQVRLRPPLGARPSLWVPLCVSLSVGASPWVPLRGCSSVAPVWWRGWLRAGGRGGDLRVAVADAAARGGVADGERPHDHAVAPCAPQALCARSLE